MVDKLLKKTLYVFMLLVIRYIYSFYLFCRMRAWGQRYFLKYAIIIHSVFIINMLTS